MKNNKAYSLLALPAVLFFAARLWQIKSGAIEPATGYLKNGVRWYHLAAIAIFAAAYVLCSALLKNSPMPRAGQVRAQKATGLLAAVSAAAVLAAAVCDAVSVLGQYKITQLFMTRSQLAALGIYSTGFKLSLVADAVGIAAAVWCALFAAKILTSGGLYDNLVLSCSVAVWLCLRAVARFASGFVNSNDVVTVTAVLACMLLANTVIAAARFISTDDSAKSAKTFTKTALMTFYLALTTLPGALHRIADGDTPSAAFAAAMAALAAFMLLVARDVISCHVTETEEGTEDEQ